MVSFPKTLSSVTTSEFGTENATSPTCNSNNNIRKPNQTKPNPLKKEPQIPDLKIFTSSYVMYGTVLLIVGGPFLEQNLARREAILVHPRFQVFTFLLPFLALNFPILWLPIFSSHQGVGARRRAWIPPANRVVVGCEARVPPSWEWNPREDWERTIAVYWRTKRRQNAIAVYWSNFH